MFFTNKIINVFLVKKVLILVLFLSISVNASGSCSEILAKYDLDTYYGYVQKAQKLEISDWSSYMEVKMILADLIYAKQNCSSSFSAYANGPSKIDQALPLLIAKLNDYLANDDKVWKTTVAENTPLSYKTYLHMYPFGTHKDEATSFVNQKATQLDNQLSKIDAEINSKPCIESSCLGISRKLPSVSASFTISNRKEYLKYLEIYETIYYFVNNCNCASWETGVQSAKPSARNALEIIGKKLQEFIGKDDIVWQIDSSFDTTKILQYLQEYPDGKHIADANGIIKKIRACGFSDQDLSIIEQLKISPSYARLVKDSFNFNPADMLRLFQNKISLQLSVLSNLRAHLLQGFTEEDYIKWQSFDTNVVNNIAWKKAGFNPSSAEEWWNAGFQPDSALIWLKNGFEPSDASEWRGLELSVLEAKQWSQAGYTFDDARIQIEAGVTLSSAIAKKAAIKNACSNVNDLHAFYTTNPYDMNGKCYDISAKVLQLFNRTTALLNVGDKTCYITFAPKSAPPNFFQGIVKGIGVYKYIDVMGSQQTAPKFIVVSTSSSQ